MDRQQFEVVLQAQAGGRIVARETLKAYRKNVLAKCYGGDVSRWARRARAPAAQPPARGCFFAGGLWAVKRGVRVPPTRPALPPPQPLPFLLPPRRSPPPAVQEAQAAGEAEGGEEAYAAAGQRGRAAGGVPRAHESGQQVLRAPLGRKSRGQQVLKGADGPKSRGQHTLTSCSFSTGMHAEALFSDRTAVSNAAQGRRPAWHRVHQAHAWSPQRSVLRL